MIDRFHSAVVDVSDFGAGADDLARLLGRSPDRLETQASEGTRSALFALANMQLEVRAAEAPASRAASGLAGIRLRCDDLDRTRAWLESRGVVCGPPTVHEAEGLDGHGKRRWRSATIDASASRGIPIELIADEIGGASDVADPPSDPPSEAPGSRIRALDHVVVLSADAEATRAFYADGLGIRLALDRSFAARGVRLLFFRLGGVTIEIGCRLEGEARPDARDRFGGLAWQVPDIDAIHARLDADGFDVSGVRDGHKPGTRVCTVRDPVHDVPTLLIEPVS